MISQLLLWHPQCLPKKPRQASAYSNCITCCMEGENFRQIKSKGRNRLHTVWPKTQTHTAVAPSCQPPANVH